MDVTRTLNVGQSFTLTFNSLRADSITPATISGIPSWSFEMATNGDSGVLIWQTSQDGLSATLTAQRIGYMVLIITVAAEVNFEAGSGVEQIQRSTIVEIAVNNLPPASGSVNISASGVAG